MSAQDYEQLTLFREDSPVSRSPSPGSSEARKMTVTSGLRCLELSGSFGPLGSLARMCLGSSIWHSTRCWLTWKTRATPSGRTLYRLAASTPRTDGNDALFWPTPSTGAALCGGTGNWKTLKAMERRGLITEAERKELSKGNGGKTNPALLEWLMGYEQAFTQLIPTPRAAASHGGSLGAFYSQTVHVEREREREAGRTVPPPLRGAGGSHSAWDNWPSEPDVDRVVDGIPDRVDRVRALGNAVVPQQAYPFFTWIAEILTEEDDR